MTIEREFPASSGPDQSHQPEHVAQALWRAHGRAWMSQAVAHSMTHRPTARPATSRPRTTTVTASLSSGEACMPTRVGSRRAPSKKASVTSASVRLHQTYGDSAATWQNRMYGATSDYQQVARINRTLRDMGLTDRLCELMAVVDASMAAVVPIRLTVALHQAELADAAEQMADETFRHKLIEGTATVADAREAIRKSAAARHKAEIAEAAILRWIEEQGRSE